MATCKHCGKNESSNWELAGYVCTSCRPQCIRPECSSCNFSSKYNTLEMESDEEVMWCHECGQVIPLEHVEQENPVDGPPEDMDVEKYIGIHFHDLK